MRFLLFVRDGRPDVGGGAFRGTTVWMMSFV
jgi:hypothetical protein